MVWCAWWACGGVRVSVSGTYLRRPTGRGRVRTSASEMVSSKWGRERQGSMTDSKRTTSTNRLTARTSQDDGSWLLPPSHSLR